MKRLLVLGILTCDISMVGVSQYPAPGSAVPVDVVTMQCGGTAANAAMDIAKLGLHVTLCGRVGNDIFGNVVENELRKYPKLTYCLARDPEHNTTTSVLAIHKTGERGIFTSLGSTLRFHRADIPGELCKEADIVFISGALLLNAFEPEEETVFLKEMQASGKYTCMDTCYDTEEVWLPKIRPALRYLDLFMPSYNEAVRLTGKTNLDEIVDALLEMGPKNIIIKLGANGAYLCEQGHPRVVIPSYNYLQCIDTTGAGDSFCAGLLCGLSIGESLYDSVRLGNMTGATCITRIGGQEGLKTLEETIALRDSTPVNPAIFPSDYIGEVQ